MRAQRGAEDIRNSPDRFSPTAEVEDGKNERSADTGAPRGSGRSGAVNDEEGHQGHPPTKGDLWSH